MSLRRPTGQRQPAGAAFDALMAEVMARADRFGHREHVHLTWLAVRRYGTGAAIALISDGIRRTARYAEAPQKYHATISRAWVELVGYHLAISDCDNFDGFADRYPALLDKRLLARYYRSSTLATVEARSGWVEPDLIPFPRANQADDGHADAAATGSAAARPSRPEKLAQPYDGPDAITRYGQPRRRSVPGW